MSTICVYSVAAYIMMINYNRGRCPYVFVSTLLGDTDEIFIINFYICSQCVIDVRRNQKLPDYTFLLIIHKGRAQFYYGVNYESRL